MRDYLSEMLYALTSAYTRKDYENRQRGSPAETNIGKLFSVFAWGLDSVQEQAELVRMWDDIDNAKGKVLDRYGANWGVKRMTPNDSIYRLAIKVKVMAQLSGGDINTVLNAASALLDVDLPELLLEEIFPAKIGLYVDWELLTDERKELVEPIAYAIKRILAAGVGFRVYVRTYRTYRQSIRIGHLGYIGTELSVIPIGQDRRNVETINVRYGGFSEKGLTGPLIGADRTAILMVKNAHITSLGSEFEDFEPVGKDRTADVSVDVAYGAFYEPGVTSYAPDAKRLSVRQQGSVGGAMYHTHIKAKRVKEE